MVRAAFYGKVSRLRTRRQEDLDKQAWKRSSSAPLPAATGQHSTVGMFNQPPLPVLAQVLVQVLVPVLV